MTITVIDRDRIEYLAGQLASMYSRGETSSSGFGNVALEILFMRNAAEEAMEKGSNADKGEAKEALKRLRELEKALVQLFMMSRLSTRKHARSDFMEFLDRGYRVAEGHRHE